MKEKMFKVTNFKRLFSAILVAVMVLTMIPVDTAVAKENATYGKAVQVSSNGVSVNLVPAKIKFDVKKVFEENGLKDASSCVYKYAKADAKSMKKFATISKKGILKGKATGVVTVGAYADKKAAEPTMALQFSIVKLTFPKTKDCVKFVGGEVFSVSDNVLEQCVVSANAVNAKENTVSQNALLSALVATGDFSITYKANSKSKVATINEAGVVTVNKNGKSGTVKVTMLVKYGEKTTKFTSKIKVKVPKLSKKKLTLKATKTKTLSVKNTYNKELQPVTWSSSNASIATVDANGKVTAVAAGNADIIATINGCEYKCGVTVK